jgi:molecular chaperone GrpE (heat shock protein)
MRKLLLAFGLLFLVGCGPTPFQMEMSQFNQKLAELTVRQKNLFALSSQTKEQEADFIKTLNDNQLSAYQLAVQGFRTNDQSTKEVARRNLSQVCDANTYSKAVELLEKKEQIQRESRAFEIDYASLQQELANIKEREYRRQDAMRDYMLINAIQQQH